MLTEEICSMFHKVVFRLLHRIAPFLRNYDFEIKGNLPDISNPYIFVCNHSNSRDFYTICEVFPEIVHPLAASDSLNTVTQLLFTVAGVVLMDRNKKADGKKAIDSLIRCIQRKESVIIYPEATWNLHPCKPMLPMKHGPAVIAQKAGIPIIPVIFEYIDSDDGIQENSIRYKKVIVTFGEARNVGIQDNVDMVTTEIRDDLSEIRWKIWEECGICERQKLDVEQQKKKQQLQIHGKDFQYFPEYEEKYILGFGNPVYEEYPINMWGYK